MNRKGTARPGQTRRARNSPTIDQSEVALALDEAAELFRGGRLSEAEQLYRTLLRFEPDNALALNNLGMLAQRAATMRQRSSSRPARWRSRIAFPISTTAPRSPMRGPDGSTRRSNAIAAPWRYVPTGRAH